MNNGMIVFGVLLSLFSDESACANFGHSLNPKTTVFILLIEFSIVILVFAGWLLKKITFSIISDAWHCWWFYFFSVLATLFSVLLGLLATYGLPAFGPVFASIGTDLPFATAIAYNERNFLWLAPIAVAFLFFAPKKFRTTTTFALICAIDVGLFVWLVWALYLPIYFACD